MFSAKASNQAEAPSSDSQASGSDSPHSAPPTTSTVPSGGNPAFLGLKSRARRALPPSIDPSRQRMPDDALRQLSLSPAAVSPFKAEPGSARSQAAVAPELEVEPPPRASLDGLPVELVLQMKLDPHQMQLVSRRYHGIYDAQAKAVSQATSPSRATSLEQVGRELDQLQRLLPSHLRHLRHGPLAILCRRLTFVPRQQRMSTFNLLFAATRECTSPSQPLTELCKALISIASLLRMDAVKRLLKAIPTDVSSSEPLAELCKQFDAVPPHQQMEAFDLLFEATKECAAPFEPLIELFRHANDMGQPNRGLCQDRLMNIEGAQGAKVAAKANNVLGYDHVPDFVASIDGLTAAHQSAALGALAKQLFGLQHHFPAHDFANLCENYYHLPWPPAAAAGLLNRIGWISPVAKTALSATSRPARA